MNTTRVGSRDSRSHDLDITQTISCFVSNCNLTEPNPNSKRTQIKPFTIVLTKLIPSVIP